MVSLPAPTTRAEAHAILRSSREELQHANGLAPEHDEEHSELGDRWPGEAGL
jgi:hypothetical protein